MEGCDFDDTIRPPSTLLLLFLLAAEAVVGATTAEHGDVACSAACAKACFNDSSNVKDR